VDAAATKVEQVLAGFVPLALGFVADFIGLGGLTDAVRDQLTKVRKVVNALIDRLLEKVLQLVSKLVTGGKKVASKAVGAAEEAGPDTRTLEQKKVALDIGLAAALVLLRDESLTPEERTVRLAQVRRRHRLTELTPVRDAVTAQTETWHVHGAVNPEADTPAVVIPLGSTPAAARIRQGSKVEVRENGKWGAKHYVVRAVPTATVPFYRVERKIGKTLAERQLAAADFGTTWRRLYVTEQQVSIEQKVALFQNGKWEEETAYTIKQVPGPGTTGAYRAERGQGAAKEVHELQAEDFGTTWRKYSPYKQGEAWAKIKKESGWANYADARQAWNYRAHRQFSNPANKDWQHIHEQSNKGPNTVENLALVDSDLNRNDLNHYFSKRYPFTGRLTLRQYLKSQSAEENTKRGLIAIAELGLTLHDRTAHLTDEETPYSLPYQEITR
jgi:hypothetical protein